MHTVEYHCWYPPGSPLSVEIAAALLTELGWADSCGVLYGSRSAKRVRIESLSMPGGEEQEKVGVFVSRIRGDVFLTEEDVSFFNRQQADLALVVAGHRGGFFVRESDGSLQSVCSREEFPVSSAALRAPIEFPILAAPPPPPRKRWRPPLPLGLLASFLLAAFALWGAFRPPEHAPGNLEVRASGRELRISWIPAGYGVLAIRDADRNLSVPVYRDQSTATYTPQSSEVEVTLLRVDAANRVHRESTRYIAAAVGSTTPEQ